MHGRNPEKDKTGPSPKSGNLWCLWSTSIQPHINVKAQDIKYIWKSKLVVCLWNLFEVSVLGVYDH